MKKLILRAGQFDHLWPRPDAPNRAAAAAAAARDAQRAKSVTATARQLVAIHEKTRGRRAG